MERCKSCQEFTLTMPLEDIQAMVDGKYVYIIVKCKDCGYVKAVSRTNDSAANKRLADAARKIYEGEG